MLEDMPPDKKPRPTNVCHRCRGPASLPEALRCDGDGCGKLLCARCQDAEERGDGYGDAWLRAESVHYCGKCVMWMDAVTVAARDAFVQACLKDDVRIAVTLARGLRRRDVSAGIDKALSQGKTSVFLAAVTDRTIPMYRSVMEHGLALLNRLQPSPPHRAPSLRRSRVVSVKRELP